ncbi:hypothetical protein [Streptomyces sp. CBMA156]|uniref:hypothetical protein n=1 Tax=Streptomyces sp. CBMA156 TaxID=1930280 RepID=UPI001661BBF0|nr:hypothetical protein [Streptomyces sp. CBMA156]MBD0673982.1 hypothetical protein [Streptomyces sp. CBMA156]
MTTNTQNLAGIRCPKWFSEEAFAVQMTMNVITFDDGVSLLGVSPPDSGHFPGRVIRDDGGSTDDEPIQRFVRRGSCGHRGTVDEPPHERHRRNLTRTGTAHKGS